jgi:hypothetical protein
VLFSLLAAARHDARLHHADAEVHRGHATLLDAIFAGCSGDTLISRQPLAVDGCR